ncbi:MAG: hypothetical protein SFU98_14475 [Leptospiraceae bacterium]|nr:hypothetical protein [Leptospiraceae bacterium]
MKIRNFCLVLFVLLIINCNNTKQLKFKKLEPMIETKANFYLLREFDPVLSIYSFDVLLYKYKANFKKEKNPVLYKEINLKNGNYFYCNLDEGYYKLTKKNDSSTEKIFYLKNNTEYFFQLYFFTKSEGIELPQFYLREIRKEDALERLLDSGKMFQVEDKK